MRNRILLLFLSFFIQPKLYSQSTNWDWAKNAESIQQCDGFSISKVVNDHIYVCGEFTGPEMKFENTTLINAGVASTKDIFIAKYKLNGELIWAKSAGGTGDDFARSISVDKAEHVYISGGFTSSTIAFEKTILNNSGSVGTHDIFINRYDADGSVAWAKSIGGRLDDKANALTTDNTGNICVIGWFGSEKILFGKDTLKNASAFGSGDVFITKLSSSGEIMWAKAATGNSEDYGYGITTDATDNIYITGGSSSQELNFSGMKIATTGYEKMYLAKYSSNGELQFTQTIGGDFNAEGTSIACDLLGNVYVTGKFSSTSITIDTTTLTNAGAFDVYVAKYSSTGTVLWATSSGGTADERGNCVITDSLGNVYVTGWFSSTEIVFGKTYLKNKGDKGTTHAFIAKYNSNGKALWSESAYGKGDDWGNGISIDNSGNVYIIGGFDSSKMNFGNTILNNTSGNDFFISKLRRP